LKDKVCSKCNIKKPINDFYIKGHICKTCKQTYEKEKRANNKNNLNKIIPQFKKCCCCKQTKINSNFYLSKIRTDGLSSECKSCILKNRKEYQAKNKEKIHKSNRFRYKENKNKIIKKVIEYEFKKRKTDNSYRIKRNFHSLFNRFKNNKKTSLEKILGYAYKDFVSYFKEDLKDIKGKSLDHIIPKSLYNHSDTEEIKKCWNLRNLRFINSEENKKKGKNIDWELIKKHNLMDLLPIHMETKKWE
jgi:hypothetical protein